MGFSMRAFLMRRWFWFVLALPLVGIAVQFFSGHDEHLLHNLLEPSGEASARLLIIALCATPLSMVLPGWWGSRWLLRNRRAIGVAAFLYGCLHLVLYVADTGGITAMWKQLGWTYIWLGWLAFVVMIPLAVTSTNGAVRQLGRNWKRLHRLAYVAAAATFLHWVAIYGIGIVGNVVLNFSPILLLAAYRIWRSRGSARNAVN
jgi:methionine sulfoxide reductase heme-binding subunit